MVVFLTKRGACTAEKHDSQGSLVADPIKSPEQALGIMDVTEAYPGPLPDIFPPFLGYLRFLSLSKYFNAAPIIKNTMKKGGLSTIFLYRWIRLDSIIFVTPMNRSVIINLY